MRVLLLLLLSLVAAESAAVTFDCTVTCTIRSDAFPPLPSEQPSQCKLFDSGTLVVTSPVLGVAGGVACNFGRTIPSGISVSYTAQGVFASDPTGVNSPFSSPPLVFTSATIDTTVPTVPTGLTATPFSATQINLAWTASTDNVGVAQYLIERCAGVGCSTYGQIGAATALTYSDTALAPATSYSYRARAQDAANNLSGYSNVATAATPAGSPTINLGETAVLTATDSNNGNLLLAQGPYVLASASTIKSLSFYIRVVGGNLRLGIYDATGPSGGPGAKKAETAQVTPAANNVWLTVPVITEVVLPAGNYWLAYLPSSSTLGFWKGTTTGVSGKYYSFTFGPMPAAFSTAPSSTTSHWSLYATFGPPPPLPPPTNLILVP